MKKINKFKDEEVSWLMENYEKFGPQGSAEFLGRTLPSVMYKANALKLRFRKYFDYGTSFDLDLNESKFLYFLGLLWADGTVSNKQVGLTIIKEDFDHIAKDIHGLGKFRQTERERENRRPITSIFSRNKTLLNFLIENDFKSKSFSEPTKILKKIDDSLHIHFWRGFFDGDGCCYKQNAITRVEFSGQYAYGWLELTKFLSELNIKHKIRRSVSSYGKNSRVTVWRQKDVRLLADIFYREMGAIFIPRKSISSILVS
jgi:hypothetical protein